MGFLEKILLQIGFYHDLSKNSQVWNLKKYMYITSNIKVV